MIQKFGRLEISPPTEVDKLETTNKQLVDLRDALRVKGELEQTEGKAKFTKDDSLLESEKYVSNKEAWSKVDAAVSRRVEKIR